MNKKLMISSLALLVASALPAKATELDTEQQGQLNEIVTLLEQNPRLIPGLHQSLNQFVEQHAAFLAALKEYQPWFQNPAHSAFGSDNPKVTIINFTDYNCPYCKRMEKELEKLVSEQDDVRVVNIHLPLKQQTVPDMDTNSSLYALNVWKNAPEKFEEVHKLLVGKQGLHDKSSLTKIAEKTGTEELLKATEEGQDIVGQNYRTFIELGLRGTPALIIGDQVAPGYMPFEQLNAIVKQQRDL